MTNSPKNTYGRKLLAALLAAVILFTGGLCNHHLNAQSLDELRQDQQEAQEAAEELEKAKQELENALGSLNSDMYDLTSSITEVQNQIQQVEAAIAEAEIQLAEAEEQADEQYADMKKRIQFMYENGSDSTWMILLQSGSFADFLNRVQYITEISRYDREMMDTYLETQDTIAAYRDTLIQQSAELENAKSELKSKEADLSTMIASARDNLSETEDELGSSQQEVDDLAEQIAAMEAYEAQVAEQKAREDAARLEEIRRQEEERKQQEEASSNTDTGNGGQEENSGEVTTATDSEAYLLACIIDCEAGGESYEAQLAVGSVVLNRVKSTYFPDNITDVIYEPGQFSPAQSGRLALKLERGPTQSCINAANSVLSGNITNDCLFFKLNDGTVDGIVIGKQVFY